ncbi:MAG: MFS transporter [Coriobacteriales bacterium]
MSQKISPRAYVELFHGGRMVRTVIGGFFGRFLLGLVMIGTLSMYTMSGYSYTLAGVAIGITQLSCCLIGPRVSRLIDKKGQTKVMPIAALISMIGVAAVMLIVHFLLPIAAAFVASVLIGFMPQTASISRARWSYVIQRDGEENTGMLGTAFSVEGILEDLSYMITPALAIVLSAQLFPEAGMLFGALFYIAGVIIMLTDRKSEPDVEFMHRQKRAGEALADEEGKRRKRSVFLAYPFLIVFFIVMILQGCLFGFFDPGTYGMAAEIATEELAGPAFICGTAASVIAVFIFGMIDWKASALKKVLIIGVAVGILYLPAAIATNLPLLYASHAIGAIAYGPLNIVLNQTVEQNVSPSRVTESLTWVLAGMQLGMAGGPTLAGLLIDTFSAQAALIATSASGVLVPVVLFACIPVLRKGLSRKKEPEAAEA